MAYKVLVLELESKRPLGRPWRRREGNKYIKAILSK
jgi:hypothetical protein